jgi:hypothetical protein
MDQSFPSTEVPWVIRFVRRFAHTCTAWRRPEHPAVDDLKRKEHIAVAGMTAREVCSPKLPALLFERFSLTRPYFKFLCDALGLPF